MTKKAMNWMRVISDLSKNSIRSYRQAVKLYEEFHGVSMDELIKEALDEQSKNIPEHELKVYDRIIDFRQSMIDDGRIFNGVVTYTTRIKTLYNKCRVRLPYLPPINQIRCNHNPVIKFEDYLTMDEIRKGIEYLPLIQKARLLAMVTGGLSNDECANLKTKEHFIDALYDYHQCDDDVDALKWLAESDNVLWVICIKRGKTGKPFYAIMNPETVTMTARAKLEEVKPLRYGKLPRTLNDKLYPTDKDYFGVCCRRINEGLGYGTAGGKSRFRPHMFRKFHATAVRGNYHIGDNSLSPVEIDELQGRGMTNVQSTYIKANPKKQKLLYCQVINQVSLWHKYGYRVIDDDVELFIINDEDENKKLLKENQKLKEKVRTASEIRDELESLMDEKGKDGLLNIIANILSES